MEKTEQIKQMYEHGKALFNAGALATYEQRMRALANLEAVLRKYEDVLLGTLKQDLNKAPYEGFMSEIGLVYGEIRMAMNNLHKWMRPKRVCPTIAQLPSSIRVLKEPYGCVLVMSPWNYPVQLTINPIVAAIAAGNTAVLKPSAYSPATSEALEVIIAEAFPAGEVQIITGGREENQALLDMPFDYIFFTGSPAVGHVVMEKAAKNLTPMTLELGGKSPAIVDETADIPKTATRLLFGKLLNAGQTCIAPDHVIVHESVKQELIIELAGMAGFIFEDQDYLERAWPKIVNKKHFDRIKKLMDGEKILFGGGANEDTLQIDFTLLDEPAWDSPVMSEEIFGPVLPIMTYSDFDELIEEQKARPKPLAVYVFTKDPVVEHRVLNELSFGGGCVNDTLMHISTSKAPFGGVGNSGMGNYHGKYGFDTFTHEKTIVKKWWLFDVPLRYHPYSNPNGKLPEIFLR